MSDDLEDFLRRAAQRRQAKSAQKPPPPKPRQRPQYSDSRTERIVRAEDLDAALDDEGYESPEETIAVRLKRIEESKRAAAKAEAEAASRLKQIEAETTRRRSQGDYYQTAQRSSQQSSQGDLSRHDLLAMLSHPEGLRQVMLLREVIDRPTHRW